MSARAEIFDRMDVLADGTRSRLLLVLESHEMTVSELRSVLQLPQSTVSRHLKILSDEGWVTSRPDGSSHRYRMAAHRVGPASRELWGLVRAELQQNATAIQDAARVKSVIAGRRTKSRAFFSTAAGQWDGLRREWFGAHPELSALPALFAGDWVVGDLGCGTGQLAEALAPFVARIIAVDESAAMLEAARTRLAQWDKVDFRQGELEALPIDAQELDVAILSLVLHYAADPACTLAEAHRVLRETGRLLIIDMMPHEREEFRSEMGHVWQGFSDEQIGGWLHEAGFDRIQYFPLSPDPDATGPTLFAASACRGVERPG